MVSKGIQCDNITQHQCISKNILKTIPNDAVYMEEKCLNPLLGIICKSGASGLILLVEFYRMSLSGDVGKGIPLLFARGRKEAEFFLR